MLDGTPILDIKPYLSSIAQEKLRRGWLAEAEAGKVREQGNEGTREQEIANSGI
jgi:tRNA (Thr-GGU) A37 N-methylase